jgi:hypothetical protein
MAGGALLAAAGAGLSVAGIMALKRRTAAEWFSEHGVLPGPDIAKLGGSQVCIYQGGPPPSDWATFRGVCDDLHQYYGFSKHRARSRADVERIIAHYPAIARLVLAGHGHTDYFMTQWGTGLSLQPSQLASYLRGRVAPNAIISLAGCSAGRAAGETESYTGAITVGGADSFAANFRDQLSIAGAPGSAEVRAHTTRGHTTENPRGRVFRVSERGQGGRPIQVAQGAEAERWILAMSGIDEVLRDPVSAVGGIGLLAGLGLAAVGIYKLVREGEA